MVAPRPPGAMAGPAAEEQGGVQGAAEVKEEAEEVKISALELVKEEELEDVKVRAVEWVGEGGKRRRVKAERDVVAAKAGPRGRGAGGKHEAGTYGSGVSSRFRGVGKDKRRKAKPWQSRIHVTEGGKQRHICIGYFAREEDAAHAFDRVSIAKLGHAEARTNFPVAQYREEWAELEALGVDGAVSRERQRRTETTTPVSK